MVPAPNPLAVENIVGGITKRFGVRAPEIEPGLLRQFRNHVRRWLKLHLTPLPVDTELEVGAWLATEHYSEARKRELLRAWDRAGGIVTRRHYRCSSFVKREHYPSIKEARMINSRSDVFKCFSGPFFKKVEEQLYKEPEFVKNVPFKKRPDNILEIATDGAVYCETDHTAFEAHISPKLMRVCELQLYRYMAKNLPNYHELMTHLHLALSGRNMCAFGGKRGGRLVQAGVEGTRMSGDMCTSLGNGFTNLMLMLFAVHGLGGTCEGRVEGDDGVFAIMGLQPGPSVFNRLGFVIKMALKGDISETSFCGNVFHPEVKANLCDAVKMIVKFGWTMSNLRFCRKHWEGLLRGKALCGLVTNAGCPMMESFCKWIMRCTTHAKVVFGGVGGRPDWWEQHLADAVRKGEAVHRGVDYRSRLLYERVYAVPVSVQVEIERYFDAQVTLHTIPLRVMEMAFCPRDGVDFTSWRQEYSAVFGIPESDLVCNKRTDWVKSLM